MLDNGQENKNTEEKGKVEGKQDLNRTWIFTEETRVSRPEEGATVGAPHTR